MILFRGQVTTLDHELRDDTMEDGPPVPQLLLSLFRRLGDLPKVLDGLWDNVAKEAKSDAFGGSTANGDVKVGALGDQVDGRLFIFEGRGGGGGEEEEGDGGGDELEHFGCN